MGVRVLGACFSVAIGVLLVPSQGHSQALRFQPQATAAAGQGNAFAAQADDASAIHYNPAGLTQVAGVQALFGTALLGGSIKATTATGVNTRGDFGGSVVFPPPSHTYVSANLGAVGWRGLSSVTVGLGLTSPYGLNTRFPVDGPFNTATTYATLPMLDIKPTVAVKLTDDLSLGVSADIYTFASFLGEGQVEQRQQGSGSLAGASIELNGKGTGAGATVGLLYAPLRNADGKAVASIALLYHTQAVVPLEGALLVNGAQAAGASTNLVLPQIYTGAVAIWPVRTAEREWKLEMDVEYVGWKSMRNLDVRLSNGTTIAQPQQWKNVPVFMVGTEYKWRHPEWLPAWEVAVRTGYTRTEDPVPDSTFNPGILPLASHMISIGAGFLCQAGGHFVGLIACGGKSALWPKAIGFEVTYQEWLYDSRTVSGNVNPTVDGRYDAHVHLGMFSFKFQF